MGFSIGNIAKKLATLHPGVQAYKKRKKIAKIAGKVAKTYARGYAKAGKKVYKGASKARRKVAKVIRNRPTLYGGNKTALMRAKQKKIMMAHRRAIYDSKSTKGQRNASKERERKTYESPAKAQRAINRHVSR